MQDLLNHLNPWLVGLLSLLGTLVTLASVACKFVPKDSPWAPWLAWFATMPIGHAPQKPLPKIDPPTTGTVLALVAFGAMQLCQGCAGTFEESKLAGVEARKAAPPVAAGSPDRCQSLSEREYWFTGAGIASGAIGAAAGSMTLPIENKTVDTVLIVTTVAGGVGAGAFGWFGANAGASYVREGCAK